MVHLVEALHSKLERRGFDSQWCHWKFSLTILPVALWPDSGTNRRPVRRADNVPTTWADCREIWEPQPTGTLRACTGFALLFM